MEHNKNMRNELFKRQEVIFEIESDKTPNFSEMKKKISEDFSKSEDVIDVFNIKGSFGKNVFSIHANVYDSKHDLDKAIQKTKKQRDAEKKAVEDVKKAEAEAKKAEAEAKKTEAEAKKAEVEASKEVKSEESD